MTRPESAETTAVTAIMTRSLLTVAADESVLMTYELLRRAGVHHAPVMKGAGHCLGLVSVDALEARIAIPHGPARPPVSELVSKYVAVPPTATIAETAQTMANADVDALLVIDGEQLVGLVSWRDIVGFVAGIARQDQRASHTHPVLFSLEPVIELADRS